MSGSAIAAGAGRRLAVLLTCFNRRETTLECLDALAAQRGPDDVAVRVYLTDDGSSDGTADAVRAAHPDATVLAGDGSLFWAGGMHLAFGRAMADGHDLYLWLNDDTRLDDDALRRLVDASDALAAAEGAPVVVAGATRDPASGATTYGGVRRGRGAKAVAFSRVEPPALGDAPRRCDTVNGNCVLIPDAVARAVGNVDDAFRHYLADFDYGLRAAAGGTPIFLVPGHVGTCEASVPARRGGGPTSLRARLAALATPKGLNVGGVDLPPIADWRRFCRRHGGALWPLLWLAPYRRLLHRAPRAAGNG